MILTSKIYRMLDANYNRTKEALRVIEDLNRFFFNQESLAKQTKSFRHRLTRIILKMPGAYRKLACSRDAAGDVGKTILIRDQVRPKLEDLLIANFKRGQESLRVLEEVSKLMDIKYSNAFRALRFELYELETKVFQKL